MSGTLSDGVFSARASVRFTRPCTPNVIVADGITKRFGSVDAVDRLSFTVRGGEIFAQLGPNGAGKTTCVGMLAGIIRPDSGQIAVSLDGRVTSALPPAQSAYLPEDRGLYREIPVLRTLIYFGRLRGLDRREAEARAMAWLKAHAPRRSPPRTR